MYSPLDDTQHSGNIRAFMPRFQVHNHDEQKEAPRPKINDSRDTPKKSKTLSASTQKILLGSQSYCSRKKVKRKQGREGGREGREIVPLGLR